MPAYFRLQDLKSITAVVAQRLEEAIDIGRFKTLVVQVRKPVAAGGTTTLKLQHAAVLEEDAFVDVASPSFNLASTTAEVNVFTDLLRFVRWKVTAYGSGTAQFTVDVVARED